MRVLDAPHGAQFSLKLSGILELDSTHTQTGCCLQIDECIIDEEAVAWFQPVLAHKL